MSGHCRLSAYDGLVFVLVSEPIAVDDWVIFQDLCQIIESASGHFEAVDTDVEEDNADGEEDVEEIAVLVISQMP